MAEPEFTIEELKNEEWRIIIEAPEFEISSLGRVRRRIASQRVPAGYILRAYHRKHGYQGINLYTDGRYKRYLVHRLVGIHFLPSPMPDQIWINHKNGNPADNRVANLEWATPSENAIHATYFLGRIPKGEAATGAKLTEADVITIHQLHKEGACCTELAARFHVSYGIIFLILKGKSWKWVYEKHGGPFKPEPQVAGEKSPNAKITANQARQIKDLLAQGQSAVSIAREMRIPKSIVYRIKDGKAWRHAI